MEKEREEQPPLKQFLYAFIKEFTYGKNGRKVDTELRIVHWFPDYENSGHPEQFVVYGKRPRTKFAGEYTPYRLVFYTLEDVVKFIQTVISPNNDITIQLQQFSGINNDSEDEYNIDWFNTAENFSTELVAFSIESKLQANGEKYLDCYDTLNNVLRILMTCETA